MIPVSAWLSRDLSLVGLVFFAFHYADVGVLLI